MAFFETLTGFWNQFTIILSSFRIPDLLDICLVAFIVYGAIKLIRETRAIKLAKGLVLLGVVYVIISVLDMNASRFIFQRLFSDFIIVLVILFHPEIRHAIENVGSSRLKNFNIFGNPRTDELKREEATKNAINAVCKAFNEMSPKKIGAILVFEKSTPLGEVITTGTIVDAMTTHELVVNVFFPMSPLHDGAAVIREGRIFAAGCILPLTQNNTLSRELGTRHRAAIGMSEQSDAMVVVLSEETGAISVAVKGTLERDISDAVLRERLMDYLVFDDSQKQADTGRIKKLFGGFRK